jgi:chemotaxis protein histidine kinase CheA
MNITDLIVELLEKGQKVVMPGIGTLDTVQRTAYHDPATHTYYPAGRAIAFSEKSDEECDIVKVLAERECINEEVAKQMWLNYIDALTDKVKRSGRHTFGRLGTLTCDDKRTFGFKMTEGLVLDADSKGEMPLQDVKTYSHEDEEDPFARFDEEETPSQEAPAVEAEPEPEQEPIAVPEPMPSKEESHWDESLKKLEDMDKEMPAIDPKADERTEKERLKAEKKAEAERIKMEKKAAEQQRYEEEMLEKQRKEAEKREAEEKRKAAEELRKAEERAEKERIKAEKEAEASRRKAEKEAAKADAKAEKERIKAEKKAAALAAIAARENAKAEAAVRSNANMDAVKQAAAQLAQEERQRREAEKQAEKERRRAEKKTAKDDDKKRRVWPIILIILALLLLCGGAAYYLLTRNNGAKPAVATASTTHIDAPAVTPFTYNPDMIDYSGREIAEQGDMVCLFMQDYINTYLADRGFSSARVPMMDRIRQYANERLEQMLGERFAVQRLLSYDDYIYNHNESFLKNRYARSCRGKVQSELMSYRALDNMLYRLADELGLQPGNGGQKTAAEVQQVKADEQKAIERRKQAAPPTDSPVYVYVEKGSKQGFDLIAGFYLNKNTAAKMTAKLHDMGCDAYIIEFNDLYYVSMGSASSQTAAEALYKHVKSWYDGDLVIKKW